MKYTKSQRHIIYKKALDRINDTYYPFLCWALNYAADTYPGSELNLSVFPEVLAQKPKITFTCFLWFDINNKKSRIAILKKAIRQTKPKTK